MPNTVRRSARPSGGALAILRSSPAGRGARDRCCCGTSRPTRRNGPRRLRAQQFGLHPSLGRGIKARLRRPRGLFRRPSGGGEVPLATLISSEYAAERRKLIQSERAFPEMPPPGKVGNSAEHQLLDRLTSREAARLRAGFGDPNPEPDTLTVRVADRFGNLFSATPSDGSYGSPVVPGTGLIPSNRGSQSRPDPQHPAGVAPGKRPRLTPNPALAIKGRDQFLPFGTPGGDVQTQAMLQVLLNLFVFGQSVQSAIESPAVCDVQLPVVIRSVRLLPWTVGSRGPHTRGRGSLSSPGADTRSSVGPTGSGLLVQSARS